MPALHPQTQADALLWVPVSCCIAGTHDSERLQRRLHAASLHPVLLPVQVLDLYGGCVVVLAHLRTVVCCRLGQPNNNASVIVNPPTH